MTTMLINTNQTTDLCVCTERELASKNNNNDQNPPLNLYTDEKGKREREEGEGRGIKIEANFVFFVSPRAPEAALLGQLRKEREEL